VNDSEFLRGEGFILRPYRSDDVDGLQAIADDAQVTRWLSARFPHPYTRADAEFWIAKTTAESPTETFAIEIDGRIAGAVGCEAHDGEKTGVAEFGYWLAPTYWGRGIVTAASRLVIAHAFEVRGLRRLEAHVFAPNVASAKVLEKCGFTKEATMRRRVTDREGNVLDAYLYARLATDR
jgi:RimJ/RimL family protein N-acetyltransferase